MPSTARRFAPRTVVEGSWLGFFQRRALCQVLLGSFFRQVVHELEEVLVTGSAHGAQGGVFDLAVVGSDGVASKSGEKGLSDTASAFECGVDGLPGHFPEPFCRNAKIRGEAQDRMIRHAAKMFVQKRNELFATWFRFDMQERSPFVAGIRP